MARTPVQAPLSAADQHDALIAAQAASEIALSERGETETFHRNAAAALDSYAKVFNSDAFVRDEESRRGAKNMGKLAFIRAEYAMHGNVHNGPLKVPEADVQGWVARVRKDLATAARGFDVARLDDSGAPTGALGAHVGRAFTAVSRAELFTGPEQGPREVRLGLKDGNLDVDTDQLDQLRTAREVLAEANSQKEKGVGPAEQKAVPLIAVGTSEERLQRINALTALVAGALAAVSPDIRDDAKIGPLLFTHGTSISLGDVNGLASAITTAVESSKDAKLKALFRNHAGWKEAWTQYLKTQLGVEDLQGSGCREKAADAQKVIGKLLAFKS
jgi:hypothetical protein